MIILNINQFLKVGKATRRARRHDDLSKEALYLQVIKNK